MPPARGGASWQEKRTKSGPTEKTAATEKSCRLWCERPLPAYVLAGQSHGPPHFAGGICRAAYHDFGERIFKQVARVVDGIVAAAEWKMAGDS